MFKISARRYTTSITLDNIAKICYDDNHLRKKAVSLPETAYYCLNLSSNIKSLAHRGRSPDFSFDTSSKPCHLAHPIRDRLEMPNLQYVPQQYGL